ncbi:MAG: PAP2 family protein, partial [Pseudomonas sp.]
CLLTALAFYGRARLEQPVLKKAEEPALAAQHQSVG